MIKLYCDLCKQEILPGQGLSSVYSRRVELSERVSVVFTLEFPRDDRPEHVCTACAIERLDTAIKLLRESETVNA